MQIRSLEDTDLDEIAAIDEKITGLYRPDLWEGRITYYLRRDPDASLVAVADDEVVGFMLGEVRSGEFGFDDPTGWVEVLGVDPERRKMAVGRQLAEQIFDYFRRQGATSVRTLVDEEREDLSGFFSSLGFQPDTVRPFVRPL